MDVGKVARAWGREEPRDTGRFFVTISRASPSQPLDVWLGGAASRGSLGSSTKRLVVF